MALWIQFNEIDTIGGGRDRYAEPTALRLAEFSYLHRDDHPDMPYAYVYFAKGMEAEGGLTADITSDAIQQAASLHAIAVPEVKNRGMIALPFSKKPARGSRAFNDMVLRPSDQFALIRPPRPYLNQDSCAIFFGLDFRAENGREERDYVKTSLPSSKVIEQLKQRGHVFIDLSTKP